MQTTKATTRTPLTWRTHHLKVIQDGRFVKEAYWVAGNYRIIQVDPFEVRLELEAPPGCGFFAPTVIGQYYGRAEAEQAAESDRVRRAS